MANAFELLLASTAPAAGASLGGLDGPFAPASFRDRPGGQLEQPVGWRPRLDRTGADPSRSDRAVRIAWHCDPPDSRKEKGPGCTPGPRGERNGLTDGLEHWLPKTDGRLEAVTRVQVTAEFAVVVWRLGHQRVRRFDAQFAHAAGQ